MVEPENLKEPVTLSPSITCNGEGPEIDPRTCRSPVTNSEPETVRLPVIITLPVEVIPPTVNMLVVTAPRSVTRSRVIPVRFSPAPK